MEKLCPYLLRGDPEDRQILAFRHPLAGLQLVKGTREPGESIAAGALRELAEESGIRGAIGPGPHWSSEDVAAGQVWHFVPVMRQSLPEHFVFQTADGGGHAFAFFWWRLSEMPGSEWHKTFVQALAEIRSKV